MALSQTPKGSWQQHDTYRIGGTFQEECDRITGLPGPGRVTSHQDQFDLLA